MPQTDLDIWNQAILKAGGRAISDFEENTPLALLGKQRYPQRRLELLSAHRWVFAKVVAQLTRLATTPTGCPYAYGFTRPNDLVGAIWDFRAGPAVTAAKVPVLQLADYIAGDDAETWAEYTALKAEATWPPWFAAVVIGACAVDVARGRLSRSQAAEFQEETFGTPEERGQGGLMGQALQADSVNAPKRALAWDAGGPLVGVRHAIQTPDELTRWGLGS